MRLAAACRTGRAPGFSLVELLVAMAIGLVLSLAVGKVLIGGQEARMSTSSVNDTNQTGAYVAYALDRAIRSAGSGFAQRRKNFGCVLNAARQGSAVLPSPNAFPAPFAGLPQTMRLAPVLIYKGASAGGSDVLAIMTGSAGYAESPQTLKPGQVTSNQFLTHNTLGIQANELMLLVDGDLNHCMIQQVASSFAESGNQTVSLGGDYHAPTGTTGQLTDMAKGTEAYAMALGRPGNWPEFSLFGVGDNTLFSHDLLRTTGINAAVPMAEGVVALRAFYGIDTTAAPDGIVDQWQDPGDGDYTAAKLLGSSPADALAAQDRLGRILAIKVGLLLRTTLAEKKDVAQASYTLFADLPGAVAVAVDPRYRHRVIEVTIPMRNLLIAAP